MIEKTPTARFTHDELDHDRSVCYQSVFFRKSKLNKGGDVEGNTS